MKVSIYLLKRFAVLFIAIVVLFAAAYSLYPDMRSSLYFLCGGMLIINGLFYFFFVKWHATFLENQQKRKMAERLSYISTMAGALAHEIRSPLSTIVLNLQLIEEYMKDKPLNLEINRILKKIEMLQKEAERLEEILDTFLGIARGEKLQISELRFNELIEEILSLHIPELEKMNIRVLKHLDDPGPICHLDRNLVKESITNILVNARQAMEKSGGDLIVRSRVDRKGIYLDIIDTGHGIPQDIQSRIFNLYFTTKKSGNGLGLARSKKIIEQHQGSISLESQPGKGTAITIFLPYKIEE